MTAAPDKRTASFFTDEDRRRRKREIVIIICVLALVALLTYAENRVVTLEGDIPVSSTILMFILININLLLLVLLIFLVFRNLVKLLYDRRRNAMGARLRTRLVVAFVTLTLLPTTVLFFFSINFITASMRFWFDASVENALESSLDVGRQIYVQTEQTALFFIEEIASHIHSRELTRQARREQLVQYLETVRQVYGLQGVEVYAGNFQQMAAAFAARFERAPPRQISADQFQKEPGSAQVESVFQPLAQGELVRTIGTIPFGIPRARADGFVVVTSVISGELTRALGDLSRGVEGYRQMKLVKRPVQYTYYLALSIVALVVVFCAVWFGFYLAKTISIPIKELAEGTLRVAEGDLDVAIDVVAGDEIGSLVASFNKMIRDLRESRSQLEQTTRVLQAQNVEIEEKRLFTEVVLKHVSAGVISLDAEGAVTTVNTSAEEMLHIKADAILRSSYRDLLAEPHLAVAEDILKRLGRSVNGAVETTVRLTIDRRPRSFLLHANILKDDRGATLGYAVVFDDLTELEKAQRLAAWREVARRIAHEVKNPLTPITLSAQRLQRKYAEKVNEPVFGECVQTIIDHVAMIRNLVNEFSAFAKFPSANPAPCRLAPVIEETVALYREGHPRVRFEVTIAEEIPELNLDRQQMKQAMINLVDNAIGAIKARGVVAISLTHDPILNRVRLEVADNGPGISDEEKIRLFEPYFSTKQTGMGLGLTIVNSIVADHFGMIRVLDNLPSGARFVIELPVGGAPSHPV